MKKVVILQSNYIPWRGYFDLINDADLFVFYDDVQYTKNDWRNRNKIVTPAGPKWLTIPTGIDAHRLICEVNLSDCAWQKSHWDSIRQNYKKAPYFRMYSDFFEEIYLARQWSSLSELNQHMIQRISADLLGIKTVFEDSRRYSLAGQRLDRLLDLVGQTGATHYISGPAAKSYIDTARFHDINVDLLWKDYAGYPEYAQANSVFAPSVSIIDLVFNTGPQAPAYIWGWRDRAGMG